MKYKEHMRYADMRKLDVSNGEGIGVSLFTQGCPFHCFNCFNPETWDYLGGKEWTDKARFEFIQLCANPHVTRISILGGEPLIEDNLKDLLELFKVIKLRFPEKKIWLWTGYTLDEIADLHSSDSSNPDRVAVLKMCDVVIDGRYDDSLKDYRLKWRGSSNQRVIDMQKTEDFNNPVLYCE